MLTRAIIVASGVEYRRLAVQNLSRFEGAGVYYAATRMEAQLCADEEIAVVGGANSAGQAAMFLAQVALFWVLPSINSASVLAIVAFIVLMCYGGGFGTMPAFVADYFGSKNVGPIYGLMLTAWGFASAFGPLLIAHMRQADGSYAEALHVIAGVMAVSVVLPLIVSPPSKLEETVRSTQSQRLKAA